MKNYIDRNTGELWAYEDDAKDSDIRSGLEPIGDSELAQIIEEREAPVVLLVAYAKRDELLAMARIRIDPLQDAVDLGKATASEVASLKKWKEYRIDVNRIDSQDGFPKTIDWPKQPA